MPDTHLISQGFELMVLGMGTVFAFLAILVLSVTKMSQLVQWFELRQPVPIPVTVPGSRRPQADAARIAAITAAVHQYRSRHR